MADDKPDLRLISGTGEPVATATNVDNWTGPPFPHPDDARLRAIVESTVASYESGELDVRGAIVQAAVNGWYEGAVDILDT